MGVLLGERTLGPLMFDDIDIVTPETECLKPGVVGVLGPAGKGDPSLLDDLLGPDRRSTAGALSAPLCRRGPRFTSCPGV